jgi:3-hydroxyacyl-CoA dehydrogenase / enoyl-CoA hydratase / 3-hydroxybutyryl-CoA epimerase
MSNLAPVTHSVDPEGIAWITFDAPSARANVFNPETFSSLKTSLAALSAEPGNGQPPVKAVVILSAKERIFLAGADLKWLAALPDEAAATQAAREGHAVFAQIADFRVPVVCAIHGACAGGGYELALACSWRLASDAPETRIGLPEVRLGLIPGWGGCTRLSRLIGAQPAVEFILRASLVPATMALTAGLVDEVVPVEELKTRAKAIALRLASEGAPLRSAPPLPAPDFFLEKRKAAPLRWREQPAVLAVFDVVEKGAYLPLAAALDLEAGLFGSVAAGEVAKNLIHIFQISEKARKTTMEGWFSTPADSVAPAPFRTIGIVGSGVMGSGIAHWCAAHGYGVILCDSSREAIERGVAVIRELFADGVRRGKVTPDAAHRMTGGIGITTSLEDFEYCDLVIETIVEDAAAKQKVFAELAAIIKPDCVLVSNSSIRPIEELTASVSHPGRIIGFHFFNLVSRMPLIELALSPHTTRATADRALALVKGLGKTAVVTRSAPGGYVTRVLCFYLNEACRLWEQGMTTETIDEAMRDWGWPMGPMRLIDEIGLDSAAALFAGMEEFFPDRFAGSKLCARMAAGGLKGRKNGVSTGFYDYAQGAEKINPEAGKFIQNDGDKSVAWPADAIQKQLNGVLIDEAKRALADGVVKTAEDGDVALILGAGFPVFRGGLIRYAESMARAKAG